MILLESKMEFDEQVNLPLPVLKATKIIMDSKKTPRHFFFTSKSYNTTARVCLGHHKPISKNFNLDKIFKNDK